MADLNSIPDETRWRIAAEFSATLPALYDHAFRETAGERYDEIEQEVWMEAAKIIVDIAKSLSLPTGTAQDLAEAMRVVMVILFGPEFKSEALEVSKDGAVIIIRRCPLLLNGSDSRHRWRTHVPQVHGLYADRHTHAQQGLLGAVCPHHVHG